MRSWLWKFISPLLPPSPLFILFTTIFLFYPPLPSPCLHVSLSPSSPLSSDTLTHSYSFLPLLIACLSSPPPLFPSPLPPSLLYKVPDSHSPTVQQRTDEGLHNRRHEDRQNWDRLIQLSSAWPSSGLASRRGFHGKDASTEIKSLSLYGWRPAWCAKGASTTEGFVKEDFSVVLWCVFVCCCVVCLHVVLFVYVLCCVVSLSGVKSASMLIASWWDTKRLHIIYTPFNSCSYYVLIICNNYFQV